MPKNEEDKPLLKRNQNLTEGSPVKVLPLFALPMVVSVIFQQLYNIADNIIAGHFLGDDALAAVSISYPVTMIYMAIAIGINAGASVVISQLFGAGRHNRMKTAISTAMIATVAIALLLTAAGFLLMKPILHLLQTPAEIFGDTWLYLVIYTAGLVFIFLYNICTGIFTAIGDSVTPLVFLIASSVGNVFLDIAFVSGLHMGVAGCAWATFACQGAAAIGAYVILRRKLAGMDGVKETRFSGTMLRMISRLAIPSILQQSFVSVGNLFVQYVVNGYDSSAVIGGYGAAVKLNTFMVSILSTLSNAVSGFTAQNIGAGKVERVSQGWRTSYLLCCILMIPASVFYFFFGNIPMLLFADSGSAGVLAVGREFLRIVSPFYVVVALKIVCDGVLRGAGVVKQFTATTFTDLILRAVLAFILPHWFGYTGIWLSWPIGWVISTVMAYVFYRMGAWKTTKILAG